MDIPILSERKVQTP